jgi:hypothetical protein
MLRLFIVRWDIAEWLWLMRCGNKWKLQKFRSKIQFGYIQNVKHIATIPVFLVYKSWMKSSGKMYSIPRHILFQWKGTLHAFIIVTYHVINFISNLWEVTDAISKLIPVNSCKRLPNCLHYFLHTVKPLSLEGLLHLWEQIKVTWIYV